MLTRVVRRRGPGRKRRRPVCSGIGDKRRMRRSCYQSESECCPSQHHPLGSNLCRDDNLDLQTQPQGEATIDDAWDQGSGTMELTVHLGVLTYATQ
jgi:hypothetical protein